MLVDSPTILLLLILVSVADYLTSGKCNSKCLECNRPTNGRTEKALYVSSLSYIHYNLRIFLYQIQDVSDLLVNTCLRVSFNSSTSF